MIRSAIILATASTALALAGGCANGPGSAPPSGFVSLFNGTDFEGWKVDALAAEHWTIRDDSLDFDGTKGDLWTIDSFEDFELLVDWRWEGPSQGPIERPIIEPDGSYRLNAEGDAITVLVEERDSGIYLRGNSKSQVNIWEWPAGSGEVYGYRTDASMPASTRAAATPLSRADHEVGDWNSFRITLVGETLNVHLNDEHVIANCVLPGVPRSGPIGLQAHGSGIQFRNLWIRPISVDRSSD